MTLNEIINLQKAFDEEHSSLFDWSNKITDDNLECLEFLTVALAGELGEFANIVKKIARGDFDINEKRKDISEEVADIFAYILKISYQLDIDLEQIYLDKMKKNKERFECYEKNK